MLLNDLPLLRQLAGCARKINHSARSASRAFYGGRYDWPPLDRRKKSTCSDNTTRQPAQRPVAASARQNRGSNMRQGQQQRNQKTPETIAETSTQAMETQTTAAGNAFFHSEGKHRGTKGVPYVAGGRSAGRDLNRGKISHVASIGHERVTYEGYLQRKMADTGVTDEGI